MQCMIIIDNFSYISSVYVSKGDDNIKPFCAYNVHMRALIAFSLHARTLNKLH